MAHFGVLCPPVGSHVSLFITLGAELTKRGHRVTFFNILDVEPQLQGTSIEFRALGVQDHPLGALARFIESGRRNGLSGLKHGMGAAIKETRMLLEEAPQAIKNAEVSALLTDAGECAGSTVAQEAGIPFVTICNALSAHRDLSVPPPFTSWPYSDTVGARLRNRLAYFVIQRVLAVFLKVVNRHRKKIHLPRLQRIEETFSTLAQISQQTREFDFPFTTLPAHFHYVGLFEREAPRSLTA